MDDNPLLLGVRTDTRLSLGDVRGVHVPVHVENILDLVVPLTSSPIALNYTFTLRTLARMAPKTWTQESFTVCTMLEGVALP